MVAFAVAEFINFGTRIAAIVRIKGTHLAHILLLLPIFDPVVNLGVLFHLSPLTHYEVVLLRILLRIEERPGLLVDADVIVSALKLVIRDDKLTPHYFAILASEYVVFLLHSLTVFIHLLHLDVCDEVRALKIQHFLRHAFSTVIKGDVFTLKQVPLFVLASSSFINWRDLGLSFPCKNIVFRRWLDHWLLGGLEVPKIIVLLNCISSIDI